MKDSYRDITFLVLFGLFFCVWKLGTGSLASWDEAQYAEVSRGMYETGNYIHTKSLGYDWYVKPPLYFWATAAFYHIFGVNEFSARLFSALCGVLVIVATYLLGRKLLGRIPALIGAGVLLSSTDFLHFARWAMLDIPNLLFYTLAVLFFIKAREKETWLYAFWASAGLAFMTKGPVIAFVFVVLFLYSVWIMDFSFLKKKALWLGTLLFALIILPWHIAVYFHNPEFFVVHYIKLHWFSRSLEAIEGHWANAYFYIRSLINKYHPWVVFLPFALLYSLYQAICKKSEAHKLLLVWTFVILGAFTFLVQTKLAWYIFPCYPAISLSIGALLAIKLKDQHVPWAKAVIALALILHIPFSGVIVQDYASGIKAVSELVRERLDKGDHIFLYEYHEQPAVAYYMDRPVKYIDSKSDFTDKLKKHKHMLLLLQDEKYAEIENDLKSNGFKVIHETEGLIDDVVLLSR